MIESVTYFQDRDLCSAYVIVEKLFSNNHITCGDIIKRNIVPGD